MGTAGTTSGWATTTRPGSAYELRFDGLDDNLSTPVNSAIMPPYFSMLFWMKLTANAPSDYALLWEAIGGGASLFLNNTNRLATYVGSGPSIIDPAATTLALQTWYHLAVVSNATQVQLYINCRLDATTTGAGALTASAFYHIFGNKPTPASRFTGAMQDMKFYNRGLAASEVCTVMRESARGEPTLLRPPLLALGLAPELAPSGALGNFFRFFGQP
jgi:Concanavalin A-like lectin/glucanases superfamily